MTMKIAFVFPGQGSPSACWTPGRAWPPSPIPWRAAALGQDLAALIAQGPVEQLNLTTNTQPAMLTAGVAFYNAWLAAGGRKPDGGRS